MHFGVRPAMDDLNLVPIAILLITFQLSLILPLILSAAAHLRYAAFVCLAVQYILIITTTTGNASLDWGLGLAITPQLLKGLELFLICTPAEVHYVRDPSHTPKQQSLTLKQKLEWVLELVYAPRGIGWNWEVPYICYAATGTRKYDPTPCTGSEALSNL